MKLTNKALYNLFQKQELPAIEGLARVSVVCADKTGTLTQNAMTLGEVIPLAGGADEVTEVLAQLVAADPAPNMSLTNDPKKSGSNGDVRIEEMNDTGIKVMLGKYPAIFSRQCFWRPDFPSLFFCAGCQDS